ncbi:MAG TPA: hypothetical protein VK116_16435, partial [Planctomycetota bacterium]|nr:hypothetical protein [Planctomycetota bacterium]
PVLLLVRAQRISDVPCLAHAPQQHRYRRLWSPSAKRPEGGQETPRERSPSRRRPPWQRLVNDLVKRTLKPSFNPKYFRRVRPAELASRARSAALCGSSSADAQLESRP